MPSRRPQIASDPVERIKELTGFKWSTIIYFLLGLIPTAFVVGFKVGDFVSSTNNKYEMTQLSLQHQKEIYEAKEAGRHQAVEDIKNTNDQAEKLIDIIEKGRKK